ncbi:MAG: AEC family transporter [Eubacteriales bacterium]|nr:AEC family transporter [Eubacteriales bacterium]
MLDIQILIDRMLVILLLMGVGFASRKLGYTDAVSNQKLSRVVINVGQVGMILGAVMTAEGAYTKQQALLMLGVSFALMFLITAYGYLAPVILRAKGPARGTYAFMAAFGNIGFVGMPIMSSVYGPESAFLVALFNIPFNLFVYSLGLTMVSGGAQKVRLSGKVFLTPPILSCIVALVIFLLEIPFPKPVSDAMVTLGQLVLPVTLIVLGGSLGTIPVRELFRDPRMYGLMVLKLLVAPVMVWAVLRLFLHDELLVGVLTVTAAMPVAAASTMLSIEYGGDEQLATKSVFLSTLLCTATIPLVVWLLLT